jgi:hypothetical protein
MFFLTSISLNMLLSTILVVNIDGLIGSNAKSHYKITILRDMLRILISIMSLNSSDITCKV